MICILLLCLVSRIFGDSIDHIRDENIETEIKGEKFEFQAEISRLMDIIINSLYTDKTVFVRELVSNAADALEKSRYASLTDKEAKPEELSAKVEVDVDSKTFTILDNGVGMTRKDLIENLGTVARSGTANFLKNFVGEGGNLDLSLIGQFGVGFYSAFLVADKVTVTSKNDLDKHQHIWQSSIGGGFTIAEDPRGNTLGRGTRITLHLKDDSLEFTNSTVVTDLIMRYNQYVNFPIYVLTPQKKASVKPSTSPEKQDEVDENDEAEEDADDDLSIDEESSTVLEWVHVNTFKPIWLRPKDTISPEEYLEFYKGLTKDYGKPLNWTHFNAEGEIDFTSILYIPSSSHSNPFGNYFSDKQESLKLYSKRVLIADVLSDVLPKWLGFIRGVVDSDDLPLKVDRENVSQQRVYKTISKKIVGKALDMMKQMSQDDTEAWIAFKNQNTVTTPPKTPYHEFWDKFGKNLKIGCSEEKNRGRIAKLLRFQSSSLNETDWTSFDEYVKRMKDSNRRKEEILFISNEYYGSAMNSPHMARYVKDNIEVLILTDPLDENCFDSLQKYEDIPLVSVEKSSMFDDPSTDDEKKMKMIKKAFEPLTKALSSQLNEHVQSVRITTKLVHDPAVVTATSFGPSAFADRVARSHTLSKHSDVYSKYQRFLDINPSHPLIKKMLLMVKNEEDIADLSNSIMDAALLGSGFVVNDPSRIARQYLSLVQERVGIAEDEVVAEYVLSEEETLAFEDTTPVADFDGHDEL